MHTDNTQEAAFLVVRGHQIRDISFNTNGWGVLEFDDEAQADRAAFKMDAPVPCRTYMRVYKALIRRVEEARETRHLEAPHG